MQKPLPPETPLNNQRFDNWLASFSAYVSPVTQLKIENWLDQFLEIDRDVAARILDAVLFVGTKQIMVQYREMLNALDGWHPDPGQRKGRWFFVPFSASSGESGDTMVHLFRMATGLNKKKFDELFIHRSELVAKKLTPDDTVVLIDDFSGTGDQAKTAWTDLFSELLYGEPHTYLMLVAATKDAVKVVRDNTEMELLCGTLLDKRHNFFNDDCKWFSKEDKATVLKYCKRANKSKPQGWGDSGLLVVLQHRCPNNSLPILHASNKNWTGIFPRQFD